MNRYLVSVLYPLGVVACAAFVYRSSECMACEEFISFALPAGISAFAVIAVPLAATSTVYYALQAVAVIAYLLTVIATEHYVGVQSIMLSLMLLDVVLSDPYPRNLIGSVTVVVSATALRMLGYAGSSIDVISVIERNAVFIVPGVLASVMGSLFTRYRNQVIGLSSSMEELQDAIVDITRANTAFQDYAVRARERATESERRRIARDIHDTVGYTLTNNMMLMEAALELTWENPLAVPPIVRAARQNAEEGLSRIRSAMHQMQSEETKPLGGLSAIARLLNLFEQATKIRIRHDYGNTPVEMPDRVESALYHVVQESLVNSFKHGRATEISVRMSVLDGYIQLHIADNGVGGTSGPAGIGLNGMRERVSALRGRFWAGQVPGGFVVAAAIPREDDPRE